MKEFLSITFFRIIALCKKEMLTILKDPKSRVVLFVPIIVQSLIFGYGASFELKHIPFSYFQNTVDKKSQDFIFELLNSHGFELVHHCHSMQCLEDDISNEKALLGLYFSSDFKHNHKIMVITDARNSVSANTAVSYLNAVSEKFNNNGKSSRLLDVNYRYLYNENVNTRYTILVGMCLALSVIQVLLLSSLSVSREKEEGSYDMMIMTPASPFELLIGKALVPIIISTIQCCILVTICVYYFAIPLKGNFLSLLFIILLFANTIVGIGLTISTLSKTTMQSLIIAFCMCLILIMTSGLLTSVDGMPWWFKYVAYANPLYYGINAMWRVFLEGASLFSVINLLMPLIVVGICTMSLATYFFRSRLD